MAPEQHAELEFLGSPVVPPSASCWMAPSHPPECGDNRHRRELSASNSADRLAQLSSTQVGGGGVGQAPRFFQ